MPTRAHALAPRPGRALPTPPPNPTLTTPTATQVQRSAEHVAGGVAHLQSAKAMQRRSRKWMCCALGLGAVVLVVVVLVTVGSVKGF
jgi:hypothetical protein